MYQNKIKHDQAKENQQNKDKKQKEIEFSSKGFTYSENTLKMYKGCFERNENYIPWIIFDSDPDIDEDAEELTQKEINKLQDLKRQCLMLDK